MSELESRARPMATIRRAGRDCEGDLAALIAAFRAELARLRGCERAPDLDAARKELEQYWSKGFPIFVAELEGRLVGYLVCRVDGNVVWAESLYVVPAYRRRGIGSALYSRAEELAEELGGSPPYNWVHPNNGVIIRFLERRGYRVLNLIELRRPLPGERPQARIRVGKHEFDY